MPQLWSQARIVGIASILFIFVSFIWATPSIARRLGGPSGDLANAHSNVVLLSQQLQSLSEQTLRSDPPSNDQLRTWLIYDERFVEENRDSKLYRYEAACAARRAGIHAMMLEQFAKADRHFGTADRLFAALEGENPGMSSYALDHCSLFLSWVRLLESQSEFQNARQRLAQAITILELQEPQGSQDHEVSRVYLLHELAILAKELGDTANAAALARKNLIALERLLAKPGVDGHLEEIKRVAQILAQP